MAEEATPSLVPTTSEEKTSSEEMAPSWKGSKRRSLGPMAFEELSEEISQDGDKTVETEESVRSTATLTLRERMNLMNAAFDKNKVPPLTTPRGFKVGETKEEGKEVLGSPTLADVKALKDHDEAGLKFDTAKPLVPPSSFKSKAPPVKKPQALAPAPVPAPALAPEPTDKLAKPPISAPTIDTKPTSDEPASESASEPESKDKPMTLRERMAKMNQAFEKGKAPKLKTPKGFQHGDNATVKDSTAKTFPTPAPAPKKVKKVLTPARKAAASHTIQERAAETHLNFKDAKPIAPAPMNSAPVSKYTANPAPLDPPAVAAIYWAKSSKVEAANVKSKVDEEVTELVEDIKRIASLSGRIDGDDFIITYGTLFDDELVQQKYEALFGTMKAARRKELIDFKGQILLKGAHDQTAIRLIGGAAQKPEPSIADEDLSKESPDKTPAKSLATKPAKSPAASSPAKRGSPADFKFRKRPLVASPKQNAPKLPPKRPSWVKEEQEPTETAPSPADTPSTTDLPSATDILSTTASNEEPPPLYKTKIALILANSLSSSSGKKKDATTTAAEAEPPSQPAKQLAASPSPPVKPLASPLPPSKFAQNLKANTLTPATKAMFGKTIRERIDENKGIDPNKSPPRASTVMRDSFPSPESIYTGLEAKKKQVSENHGPQDDDKADGATPATKHNPTSARAAVSKIAGRFGGSVNAMSPSPKKKRDGSGNLTSNWIKPPSDSDPRVEAKANKATVVGKGVGVMYDKSPAKDSQEAVKVEVAAEAIDAPRPQSIRERIKSMQLDRGANKNLKPNFVVQNAKKADAGAVSPTKVKPAAEEKSNTTEFKTPLKKPVTVKQTTTMVFTSPLSDKQEEKPKPQRIQSKESIRHYVKTLRSTSQAKMKIETNEEEARWEDNTKAEVKESKEPETKDSEQKTADNDAKSNDVESSNVDSGTKSPSKKSKASVKTMKAFLNGDDISVDDEVATAPTKNDDGDNEEVVDSISKQILEATEENNMKLQDEKEPAFELSTDDIPEVFASSPSEAASPSSQASTSDRLSTTKWLEEKYPYLQKNSFSSKSESGSESDNENAMKGSKGEVLKEEQNYNEIGEDLYEDLSRDLSKEEDGDDLFDDLDHQSDDLFDGLDSDSVSDAGSPSGFPTPDSGSNVTSKAKSTFWANKAVNVDTKAGTENRIGTSMGDINGYLMQQIDQKKQAEENIKKRDNKSKYRVPSPERRPRTPTSPRKSSTQAEARTTTPADDPSFSSINKEHERLWNKWEKFDNKLEVKEKERQAQADSDKKKKIEHDKRNKPVHGLALLANEIDKIELPTDSDSRFKFSKVTPKSRKTTPRYAPDDDGSVETTLTEAERIKAVQTSILNNQKELSEAKAKKMADQTANTVASEKSSGSFWKAPGSKKGTVLGNKELKSLVSVNNKADRSSADSAVEKMNNELNAIKKKAAMQEIMKEKVVRKEDNKERIKAEKKLKKLEEKAAKKRAKKEAADLKSAAKAAKKQARENANTPAKGALITANTNDIEVKSIGSKKSNTSSQSKKVMVKRGMTGKGNDKKAAKAKLAEARAADVALAKKLKDENAAAKVAAKAAAKAVSRGQSSSNAKVNLIGKEVLRASTSEDITYVDDEEIEVTIKPHQNLSVDVRDMNIGRKIVSIPVNVKSEKRSATVDKAEKKSPRKRVGGFFSSKKRTKSKEAEKGKVQKKEKTVGSKGVVGKLNDLYNLSSEGGHEKEEESHTTKASAPVAKEQVKPKQTSEPLTSFTKNDVKVFEQFRKMMTNDGIRALKLSKSGIWEKKILCVSKESLTVTSPNGDFELKVPIAMLWINDEKNKPLIALERNQKPINSCKWADRPRHGNGGIFFEDFQSMEFSEDGITNGPGGAMEVLPKSPPGKSSWSSKYDMKSLMTIERITENGTYNHFVFCFRKGNMEGGIDNESNAVNTLINGAGLIHGMSRRGDRAALAKTHIDHRQGGNHSGSTMEDDSDEGIECSIIYEKVAVVEEDVVERNDQKNNILSSAFKFGIPISPKKGRSPVKGKPSVASHNKMASAERRKNDLLRKENELKRLEMDIAEKKAFIRAKGGGKPKTGEAQVLVTTLDQLQGASSCNGQFSM